MDDGMSLVDGAMFGTFVGFLISMGSCIVMNIPETNIYFAGMFVTYIFVGVLVGTIIGIAVPTLIELSR